MPKKLVIKLFKKLDGSWNLPTRKMLGNIMLDNYWKEVKKELKSNFKKLECYTIDVDKGGKKGNNLYGVNLNYFDENRRRS